MSVKNLIKVVTLLFPKQIKVVGVEYSVAEKPFIEIDGNRNYQGACWYDKTEIQVVEAISNERKKQVFVHELVHAIFHEAGFEVQDEDTVNRVGIVLHQVLKDNNFGWLKE